MLKQVLTAASLAVLLAGTATAANDHAKPSASPKASADTVRPARTAPPAEYSEAFKAYTQGTSRSPE